MDTGETGSTSASGFGLLSRCSSFSLFFPWFWEILMCQAPLELPGLSMSLSQVKSFKKSHLCSQVKAKLFRWFRLGNSAPGVVRLGFHDCLKYKDGTGGCDGCLNWHGMGVITHVHMISLSHCASIVFLLTWLTLDEKKTWTRGTTTGWRGPLRSSSGSTPTRINQEPPLVWMNP